MSIRTFPGIMTIILCLASSCGSNNKPLYQSDKFSIYSDSVTEGEFTATALSPEQMKSDFISRNTEAKPVIEFKFSINGRDNELPFGVNHLANIYPSENDTVILRLTFGKISGITSSSGNNLSLPPNTRVKFIVDFRDVLKSFEEKGYYDDIAGNRIYAKDFKGLYIAGDTFPLSWDFENLSGNEALEMKDPDGDGFFENELIFNIYDPSAHTSSEWKQSNDISAYPSFTSRYVLQEALYNMALDEMMMLMEDDGTFRTGKEWAGVWTRDISYATLLSLAGVEPARCMTSLMRKVSDKRIVQDTGTGGAWPVSSDRVVWALAAWEIYKYTGNREWLEQAFEITRNSIEADSKTIIDPITGLVRGESSFLDWRKQTYPLWMEPSDIYCSLNLGTNAAYYQALKVTGMMARELGVEDIWSASAEKIKENINKYLWAGDKGYYGQYLYGRYFRSLSSRAEALGEAFTVLFDIADEEQADKVLANTPVSPYGITCISPQIPGIPPYHNNAVWPFVETFWTMACAQEKYAGAVEFGLASVMRPAALFLTNKENFRAENGDFAGTEINSDRQLWSVASMIAIYQHVLMGIGTESDRMTFNPVIPGNFRGTYQLRNFRYRDGLYNITVDGWGDEIRSFSLDGKDQEQHYIPAALTDSHDIVIVMNGKCKKDTFRTTPISIAPETHVLTAGNKMLRWQASKDACRYLLFINGKQESETTDTSLTVEPVNLLREYQVMAINDKGTGSFLSNPVSFSPDSSVIKLEAEDFNLKSESVAAGFSGRGYVRFSIKDEQTLSVSLQAEGGIYAIRMRYANGTGPVNTDNNCAIRSLYVNGSFITSLVFPQRGSNEWSDWGLTCVERIKLKDGVNNMTIKYNDFNRNMDGEINEFLLDYIVLQRMDGDE